MSSVQLLDKTRKIGKLLHNNNSSKVVFNDICKVMREILGSNILVISRKGKVLGVGEADGVEPITELINAGVGGFIDPMLNERLLGVLSTKENVNLETLLSYRKNGELHSFLDKFASQQETDIRTGDAQAVDPPTDAT